MEGAGDSEAGGFARGWHVVEQNSSSLFVSDSALCNTEIRRLAPGSPPPMTQQTQAQILALSRPQFVSTVDGLESELKAACSPGTSTITLIHRANSWSRLKITVDMFKLLCDASGIDCSFATFILGMGKKLQPKDEHYMNSYTKFYRLRHDSSGERLQGESFSEELADFKSNAGPCG